MEIYDNLKDIKRYIYSFKDFSLEDMKDQFDYIMKYIKNFKTINRNIEIFEIGSGIGTFEIISGLEGINCKAIDISPQLVQKAKELGKSYGVEVDIEVANIENKDIGLAKYDIIIASSVFEHVKLWRKSIKKVYDALKPHGLFYFSSTNKFSLYSGEFNFPFYGWLPNWLRYKLRVWFQEEKIMKLGIDFNQFTYFHLRRFFSSLGFSKVMSIFEAINIEDFNDSGLIKKAIIKCCKQSKLIKAFFEFFMHDTVFICIK